MRLISPQSVMSDDGATIQVADRYTVEYTDKTSKWSVEVDFGVDTTGVLRSTLQLDIGPASKSADAVFQCILDALVLMGQDCEILK